MILVHQRYVAKPGLAGAVLDTRMEASRRLAELQVPVGEIWVAVRSAAPPDAGDAADVIWECRYASLEERERIRALQEADPAFHAIRTRQSQQLARWAREHYRLVEWR
jgi:hypothetical protein